MNALRPVCHKYDKHNLLKRCGKNVLLSIVTLTRGTAGGGLGGGATLFPGLLPGHGKGPENEVEGGGRIPPPRSTTLI